MDVNNRKTALNDDSILYQKRDDTTTKTDVKSLDKKARVQYFMDYYLLKVIVGALVLIFLSYTIYTVCFRHLETVVTLSCIGDTYITDYEIMAQDLREPFGLTSKNQEIYVSNYNVNNYNMQIAFSTHTSAGNVDLILCDKEQFERYALPGMFADLRDYLSDDLYESVSSSVIEGQTAEYDSNGDPESLNPAYPMVIDVTGNAFLANYNTEGEHWYLGICSTTERPEHAVQLLEYIITGSFQVTEQEQ